MAGNYTKVPNDNIEALAKLKLNGTQRRILDVVFRYTSGFNREAHSFSISFICIAMGLEKKQEKQVRRELDSLIKLSILTEVKPPTKNSSRVLMVNANIDHWAKKTTGLIKPLDKLDHSEWTNKTTQAVDYLDHQERKVIKENSKESIYIVFQHWNSKKIITHKTLTEKVSGHINARIEEGYAVEEIIEAIDNYETILRDNDRYYWSYKWGLSDFLVRGLDKFKTESDPFGNYANKSKANIPKAYKPNRPRSFDAIDQWYDMTKGMENE